jgi:hypothetical protein
MYRLIQFHHAWNYYVQNVSYKGGNFLVIQQSGICSNVNLPSRATDVDDHDDDDDDDDDDNNDDDDDHNDDDDNDNDEDDNDDTIKFYACRKEGKRCGFAVSLPPKSAINLTVTDATPVKAPPTAAHSDSDIDSDSGSGSEQSMKEEESSTG